MSSSATSDAIRLLARLSEFRSSGPFPDDDTTRMFTRTPWEALKSSGEAWGEGEKGRSNRRKDGVVRKGRKSGSARRLATKHQPGDGGQDETRVSSRTRRGEDKSRVRSGTRHEEDETRNRIATRHEEDETRARNGTRHEEDETRTRIGTRHEEDETRARHGTRHEEDETRTRIGTRYEEDGTRTRNGTRHEEDETRARIGTRHEKDETRVRIGTRHEEKGRKDRREEGGRSKNRITHEEEEGTGPSTAEGSAKNRIRQEEEEGTGPINEDGRRFQKNRTKPEEEGTGPSKAEGNAKIRRTDEEEEGKSPSKDSAKNRRTHEEEEGKSPSKYIAKNGSRHEEVKGTGPSEDDGSRLAKMRRSCEEDGGTGESPKKESRLAKSTSRHEEDEHGPNGKRTENDMGKNGKEQLKRVFRDVIESLKSLEEMGEFVRDKSMGKLMDELEDTVKNLKRTNEEIRKLCEVRPKKKSKTSAYDEKEEGIIIRLKKSNAEYNDKSKDIVKTYADGNEEERIRLKKGKAEFYGKTDKFKIKSHADQAFSGNSIALNKPTRMRQKPEPTVATMPVLNDVDIPTFPTLPPPVIDDGCVLMLPTPDLKISFEKIRGVVLSDPFVKLRIPEVKSNTISENGVRIPKPYKEDHACMCVMCGKPIQKQQERVCLDSVCKHHRYHVDCCVFWSSLCENDPMLTCFSSVLDVR